MNRVRDKVAIVTGGAMGIGEASARLLAREGAHVAVTDVEEKTGRAVAESIRADGGEAQFWSLDVGDEEAVQTTFAEIHDHYERVHVLVNNAGISGANKPTDEVTEEEWDRVMQINVKGVFFCTKHVIPYLKEAGGGSIVNLSSIYGLVSAPDVPPYHASKGAVRLMTKTDALLYAGDKIRVNSAIRGSSGPRWSRTTSRALATLKRVGKRSLSFTRLATWGRPTTSRMASSISLPTNRSL